jgi:hypothetical protein
MNAAAQTLRPKAAWDTAQVRRSAVPPMRMAAASGGPRYLRASLAVGSVNDPEEHEAEHAARVVAGGGQYKVRDPGGGAHLRALAAPPVTDPGAEGRVRRMAVPEVVDPAAAGRIRRAAAAPPPPASDAAAASRIDAARQAVANPLPPPVKARLEHGLGRRMDDVRVHKGPEARAAAASIGARAYTEGNRITLGHGESEHDLHLMAHEATHVVQNRAAGVQRAPIRRLGLDTVRDYFADHASDIPGFRMFTIVIGINPITMQSVDASPANIMRAVVGLMLGGEMIVRALDKYQVFDKVAGWVSQQIDSLAITGAAISNAASTFLHSLGGNDFLHPGDAWDRAVRIFTEPIARIKSFVAGLVDGVLQFIKDAVLHPLAELASRTRAWDLLIALLGTNPITNEGVKQDAPTLIGGFMKLISQDEVWENIKKSNAIDRAFAWFQGAMGALLAFARQIPKLFLTALKSFSIGDLLDLPGTIGRVLGIFGDFAGRFIGWAGDAMWKLLEIVFDVVSPGAFAYVKRTGDALKSILKNPIPFVGNLVQAAKLGLGNFAGNIGAHLKSGLIDWLTGSLPGVYIPKAFSLIEVGKFALSVLGITWAQIRGKIVKALGPGGEKIMTGLETAFDVVVALVRGGPAAAWDAIKDKLANLKDMVIEGITGFVVDTIVKKAIPKLVAMFIPGAGFISAILSIYGTISAFMARLSKVVAAVTAFIDSIVAIAAGQIAGAAARVESALAGVLSLAIGLLAGFLGLDGIASKVMAVVAKVRGIVDKALDTAIGWIVGKAKSLFAKLFGKDKKDDKKDAPADPNTKKAVGIVQQRVGKLLGQGLPREQLRAQVRPWAAELGVKRVDVEEGGDGDSVFVENSPRFTTNEVISGSVQGVYRMILDIAKERLGAAKTPIPTAKGPWKRPYAIDVAPGSNPLSIARGLQAQAPVTGVGVGYGVGVPIQFGSERITAARRGGVANFVITNLGKYPEIAEMLQKRGMSAGDLAQKMADANRLGSTDPDILGAIALMHGAEPAREALSAGSAPLLLGAGLDPASSVRGASPAEIFGTDKTGGLDPVSPQGARKTQQRAEAMTAPDDPKEYPAGTNIAEATDKHIESVAQLVFRAVMHLDFVDTAALKKRVLEVIATYDKASGTGT